MFIVGIDPGLSGAVAIINDATKYQYVFDIPIMQRGKTKGKNELDCRSLYLKLEPLTLQEETVVFYLEQVNSMPGQGVTSMFSMGHTLGGIKGIIASLGFELRMILPQKWKKYFNLNSDKELSRATAIKMFPQMVESLQRKKDADRAEALLIARYGKIHYEH